jgi:hypothetical protein
MRKKAAAIGAVAAILVGLYGCFTAFEQWRYETMRRWLIGPFVGRATSVPVEGALADSIRGPGGVALEVHELRSGGAPILVLRSRSNTLVWARQMVPVKVSDGEADPGLEVFRVRLDCLVRRRETYVTWIIGDWTGGTNQEGEIRLNRDLSFRDFSLMGRLPKLERPGPPGPATQ